MRIALIQQYATSDIEKNRQHGIDAVYRAADQGASLVAFAELAFTPFYPQHRAASPPLHLAEPIPGPTTRLFQEVARACGVVIVLNLYERDGNRGFDTSPVIDADGTLLGKTRMMHITQYEGFYEQDYYTPGDTGISVYDTAVGRIGVCICYDRHFPEYLRALALQEAQLVIVPQAGAVGEWPEGVYEAEMQIASFQNGFFTALVNRVGKEETLTFSGESFVTAPDGRVIARAPALKEHILYADIDLSACETSHARKLFLQHRRPEAYRPFFCS